MKTPPIWLGDAVGGLVTAAVLGLPAVALKRSFPRWLRALAALVWFGVVGTISYYSLQDIQIPFPLVPPVLLWKFTLWKVLVVAFGLTALIWGLVRWRAPRRSDHRELWGSLDDNERAVLEVLLACPDVELPGAMVTAVRENFGNAGWNSVTLSLKAMGLLDSAPGGGLRPSAEGSALLLWASRGPLRVPDPPASGAPSSSNPRPARVTWSQLTDAEREFLNAMWNRGGAFISYVDTLAYQEKWGGGSGIPPSSESTAPS